MAGGLFSFAYNPSVNYVASSLPRKEPYAALHESAYAMNRIASYAEGNSCSLLQFTTRSVNSCNREVAIHCKDCSLLRTLPQSLRASSLPDGALLSFLVPSSSRSDFIQVLLGFHPNGISSALVDFIPFAFRINFAFRASHFTLKKARHVVELFIY